MKQDSMKPTEKNDSNAEAQTQTLEPAPSYTADQIKAMAGIGQKRDPMAWQLCHILATTAKLQIPSLDQKTGMPKEKKRLDPNEVRLMRRFIAAGIPLMQIADAFNVGYYTVVAIKARRTWKLLTDVPPNLGFQSDVDGNHYWTFILGIYPQGAAVLNGPEGLKIKTVGLYSSPGDQRLLRKETAPAWMKDHFGDACKWKLEFADLQDKYLPKTL